MSNKLIYTIVLGYFFLLLIAPLLSTHDPRQTNTANIASTPTTEHWLGTDQLGRDVYSRLLHGGQRTVSIAGLALAIATIPALLLGIFSQLAPRWAGECLKILLNTLLAFPALLMALIVLTTLGRGFTQIAIATGIAQMPYMLQVICETLSQQTARPHILAAQSLGATQWHILYKHILPHALPVIVAYVATTFSYCIINSAALSLLGLGSDPSIPEWGTMLASGRAIYRVAPLTALAPAVAITLTVILTNKLSNTIR
ncbi:MAG: ABC transporter permease [Chloroflexota bacterium]